MIMNIVRIAKVVALLAFVLPWVAISCSGTDLATASGIELIQGTMSENPDAAKQMGASMGLPPDATTSEGGTTDKPELGMNFFALGAAIAIIAGLGLTFVGGAKSAGRNAIITSLVAAALVYGAVWSFKESAKADMAKDQGGGSAASAENPFGGDMSGMGAMGADMLNEMLQERIGFWLALGALIVAAGAGGVAMASGGGSNSVRPDSM
jgi:hypothetical protein